MDEVLALVRLGRTVAERTALERYADLPLPRRQGRAYPRFRDTELPERALTTMKDRRARAEAALAAAYDIVARLDGDIRGLAERAQDLPPGYGDLAGEDWAFECCDLEDARHRLGQQLGLAMAAFTEIYTQSFAYLDNVECILVCPPHPCAPGGDGPEALAPVAGPAPVKPQAPPPEPAKGGRTSA
jgi:hypothetical protein